MKMTWFQHPACTTEEADELVKQYRRRGVKTERSLNHDCINWTVSALLSGRARARVPGGDDSCQQRV